jgi:hypothetical protein
MSVATLASCDYGNFRYNRNVRIVSIVSKAIAVGTTIMSDGTSGVVLLKPSTAQPNDQRVPYDFEMTVNASRNTFLGQKGSVKEVQAYVGQSTLGNYFIIFNVLICNVVNLTYFLPLQLG